MLNIMLSGCCGSMGRAVTAFAGNRDDIKITAGIDREGRECKFPTFVSPFSFNGKVDVIIDFSSPAALPGLLAYAVESKTPAVIATTGLGEAHIALIYEAAKNIPIFFSANMSLGINLLCELAKTAARVLGGTYDIEIVETHHAQKADAPSGTALMLADAISSELERKPYYEYDRHLRRTKRPHDEIGIHSIRGGTAVGVLEIATQLRAENKKIKISVSSGNCKISVSGAEMEGRPGVAARVFKAAADAGCDIRMINTSETEISLLVVKADVDATIAAIKKEFE